MKGCNVMITINLLSKINKRFIKKALKLSSQKNFYLFFALNEQEKENFLEAFATQTPILSITPVWQWPGTIIRRTPSASPQWGIKVPIIDTEIPVFLSFITDNLLTRLMTSGDFAILDKSFYPWFITIIHEHDAYFITDEADSNGAIPFLQENHFRFWVRKSIYEPEYKPY